MTLHIETLRMEKQLERAKRAREWEVRVEVGVRVTVKKGREQYKQLKLGALDGELAIETVCELNE
jgi:hypothetical protein